MPRVKKGDDLRLVPSPEESEGPLLIVSNIARLRAQRGWSEPMLAQKCGVPEAELVKILDGRTMPAIEVLWKIANALRVPIATLLRPLRSDL